MIVGGYDLHLYCDTGNDAPDTVNPATVPHLHGYLGGGQSEYAGHNEADCKRQAKKAGWHFARDDRVYCPKCNKSKRVK